MNLLNRTSCLECMADARDVSLATITVETKSIIFILLVVPICLNSLEYMLVYFFTIIELVLGVID